MTPLQTIPFYTIGIYSCNDWLIIQESKMTAKTRPVILAWAGCGGREGTPIHPERPTKAGPVTQCQIVLMPP